MKNLLSDEKGNTSSMRFSLILVTIGAFLLFVSAAIYIVLSAINPELPEPSWEAMGLFLAGIATIVTGAGWSKTKQKELELNENK